VLVHSLLENLVMSNRKVIHLGQGSLLQGLREFLDVDLKVPDESAGELVDKVLQGSHGVASKERLILLCSAVIAELFWQASGSNKSS
jgi:hypothetical protein